MNRLYLGGCAVAGLAVGTFVGSVTIWHASRVRYQKMDHIDIGPWYPGVLLGRGRSESSGRVM